MLVNKIISSILEIFLVSIIPLILWLTTKKGKISFFEWIGLKRINKSNIKKLSISCIGITIIYVLISFIILLLTKNAETATSEFNSMGIKALLPALVYAIFNTSLPEEILFRGFILKNLSSKLGYKIANIIQSILFGLLHGIMFFSLLGSIKTIIIILFTSIVAFGMGYINEEKANGSILPSWFIHASSNIFASIVAMFSLL